MTRSKVKLPKKTEDVSEAGGVKPKSADDSSARLPINQRLYLKYRPLLSEFAEKHPNISYSIDDASLATNLHFVLEKSGFSMHSRPNLRALNLTQYLTYWLKRGHIILLHYRPKLAEYNLIDLLKDIKAVEPDVSLAGLIPLFVSPASSKKQLDVFRMLAGFGVRYAMFLSSSASLEKNLEEALQSMVGYHEALEAGFSAPEKEPKGFATKDTDRLEQYDYLIKTGEDLMKKGRLEDAIKAFTAAIELKPNFKALINRGDAYYKSRKVVPALNDYREAARMLESAPEPYAKISACCFTLARQAVINEGPEKARRWVEAGLKNIGEAVSVVRKTQRDSRQYPGFVSRSTPYGSILFALAEADLRETGLDAEWSKVVSLTEKILEETRDIDSENPDFEINVRIDRAIILARNMFYEEAEKIFRDVIEKNPEAAGPAFNNFAVELRKNGEYGKAFEIYLELLKYPVPDRAIIVENMVTAGLRYGSALRKEGKRDKAVVAYKDILIHKAQGRGKETTLCELAMTYLELGNNAEASSRLIEAVYLNPDMMKEPGFTGRYPGLSALGKEMAEKLRVAAD